MIKIYENPGPNPEPNEGEPSAFEILKSATDEFLLEHGKTEHNVAMVEAFLRSVKTEAGEDRVVKLRELIGVLDKSAKFALDLKARLERKLREGRDRN